jgi:ABC-type uncharacterized transport system substrate-binding protein
MNRRGIIKLLGATAVAWPPAARAQPPLPVIGFLNGQSARSFAHLVAAFRHGLNQTGYVEGRNVTVEYRWAEGRVDRLPTLANDLVRRRVDVIVATGGAHRVAKAATATIPIVCTMGSDPVQTGLVASISRPGGNLTGAMIFSHELEAKRMEIVRDLVPKAKLIGVLLDPTFPSVQTQLQQVHQAARVMGRQIRIMHANTEREIEMTFTTLVNEGAGAVVVTANPFFNSKRAQIVALAAYHRIPALFEYREAPLAGGLVSYGPSIPAIYRQVGLYAGRILKGEKPADLPVVRPAKFELVINLKTAKSLGLTVPPMLLARADDVIE